MQQGMDEEPREASGDQHGEEDESEHQAPGGAVVVGRGCLRRSFFLRIGHCSVYGGRLLIERKMTEEACGGSEIVGLAACIATQIQGKGV
jgi:hypothetical protein